VATVVCVGATCVLSPRISYADDIRNAQWHINDLGLKEAHQLTTGSGIVVGVVDSGVDPHPDLRRNLLEGYDVGSSDGGGKVDRTGHGTEMAGLIAAHGQANGAGALGVAPSAKILPVRDSNSENLSTDSISAAIEWAARHDASVINVSMGTVPSLALQDAIQAAKAEDAIVVASAGNRSTSGEVAYPAAMPGVLAVGASDRAGKHASFSLAGKEVQICGPGVDIVSTRPAGKYVKADGTSAATSIVSGAAALVRAKFPELSAPEVIHRLTATADDVGAPGRDDECGFGVLNIVKALTADVPPLAGTAAPAGSPPAGSAGSAAQPETEDSGSSLPLAIGGIGIGLLLVGGLLAFLVNRRRKGRVQPADEQQPERAGP
jgi:type VII secretion-associated serine protease mycosin